MRTTIAALRTGRAALLVRVRQLESLLKNSEARCAKLEYKLQDLLRRIFSPKKEKLNPAQQALFGPPEASAAAQAQLSMASETSTAGGAKREKGGGLHLLNPIHQQLKRKIRDSGYVDNVP